MISGKINLAMFKHAIQTKKKKNGEEVECIVIPIVDNNLFKSDNGNVYLDLIAFDSVKTEYKQTHLVKQSLPKEIREAMSEEERKSQPIIGNLNANMTPSEQQPNTIEPEHGFNEDEDDLPF